MAITLDDHSHTLLLHSAKSAAVHASITDTTIILGKRMERHSITASSELCFMVEFKERRLALVAHSKQDLLDFVSGVNAYVAMLKSREASIYLSAQIPLNKTSYYSITTTAVTPPRDQHGHLKLHSQRGRIELDYTKADIWSLGLILATMLSTKDTGVVDSKKQLLSDTLPSLPPGLVSDASVATTSSSVTAICVDITNTLMVTPSARWSSMDVRRCATRMPLR